MSLCRDKASFLLIEHSKERRRLIERHSGCAIFDQQESVLAAGSGQLALCLAVHCYDCNTSRRKRERELVGHGGAPIDSDMNSNAQYLEFTIYTPPYRATGGNRGPIGLQAPILDTQSSLQGALLLSEARDYCDPFCSILYDRRSRSHIYPNSPLLCTTTRATPGQKSLIGRTSCFMLHMAITH